MKQLNKIQNNQLELNKTRRNNNNNNKNYARKIVILRFYDEESEKPKELAD